MSRTEGGRKVPLVPVRVVRLPRRCSSLMEPSLFASSPDKSELDLKLSFRKPANDATSRKYQHHSPVGKSDSSASGGDVPSSTTGDVNSAKVAAMKAAELGSRARTQRQRWKPPTSKETGGARYRSGEAVYFWSSAKRWSNIWSWLIMSLV
ncbi:hypothetical protein OPV22_026239 [Ensete ventricosum]|uniref:DUF4005 domain-containing protein n=1 Tax=Ensete ventricosum TaxID=4639 RepID=A0AAV8PAI4_ENSVE|nr:hypothetical protein OPV22_026239 [Ensete ventricosum]